MCQQFVLTEFGFLAILVMVGCAWLAEQAFSDHALSPHSAWPYSASRDAGLADTGAGGYPTCKQRWADDTVGIDHFGASAPGDVLFREFGFTVEHVADRARALLNDLSPSI